MICCDYLYYDNLPEDIKLCLPDLGKDTLPMLNECESKYFNFCFQSVKDSFDFSEKNCIAARYFHKHYNYEWDEIRYPFHDYR